MPVITLYDGSKLNFDNPVSTIDVVRYINKEKNCIAGSINGELIDAVDLINQDVKLSIITVNDQAGLEIIRHSCAHLLGQAIKEIWPNAKMVMSKVVNNGFFYDIDLKNNLTNNDLYILENMMYQLANKNEKIIKEKVSLQQARNIFLSLGESYKVAIIDKYFNKVDKVFLYHYKEYIDMCLVQPHVPKINFCKYLKLQNVTKSYWYDKKILQRIYGIAWGNKKQLNTYFNNLKETEKRDHRKIGKQLNLYHIQEEAPGMVFWHNDGWTIFCELEAFVRAELKNYDYQEVKGPFMMTRELWDKTGHWENYSENMFTTFSEKREFCIKPMNCPGHVQIFNHSIKSYRDLPLRIAEFGSCHRNEPSGSLHGLMRVRCFTQDDAHIFCTEDQVGNEIKNCIKMVYNMYSIFGFKNILVKLSTRPKKRIGSDALWDKTEKKLENLLKECSIDFEYQKGDGVFYGPKIEFSLLDCLNRVWQCGTIQLDFSLPERLGAYYINERNERAIPIMIHRAILGSIERFIGILTEEYAGFYPTWLAPTQVVVMNITNNQLDYAEKLKKQISYAGIRVKADLRNEKIGLKIRYHTLRRVPYMLICGNKEISVNKVTVRTRYGKNLGIIELYKLIENLQCEISNRNIHQLEELKH